MNQKSNENGSLPTARKKMGALVLQSPELAWKWILLQNLQIKAQADFSSSENQGRESSTVIPKFLIFRLWDNKSVLF